jgi:hypothetical protein
VDLNRAAQALMRSVGVRGVLRPEWGFLRVVRNTSRAAFLPEGVMVYQETFVQRDHHRIYVRDHPGAEPTIILMHGFPDNLHLYDRLTPYLSPPTPSRSI